MTTGVVTRIVADKGFGFIKAEGSGIEYFFHRSACLVPFDGFAQGDKVTFEASEGEKGPRAGKVAKKS